MANRTAKDAKSIHGTNPQYLVEKIIRSRIYDSRYWKEFCFALTAELIIDRAAELRYIGGVYGGNIKPTPFLCLLLKMLQIQPDRDVVIEYIRQDDFKYIRALGATYWRLTTSSVDCYRYLEPLYNDFRKLRTLDRMGNFSMIHMDEYIDTLLHEERVCDIQLPRLASRAALEQTGELEPRVSPLDEDLDAQVEAVSESESEEEEHATSTRSIQKETRQRSSSPPPAKKSHKESHREKSPPGQHRNRVRSSSRSPSPKSRLELEGSGRGEKRSDKSKSSKEDSHGEKGYERERHKHEKVKEKDREKDKKAGHRKKEERRSRSPPKAAGRSSEREREKERHRH